MLTEIVMKHQAELGILSCCDAIGIPRSSYYRARTPKHGPHRRRKVPRALTESQQKEVLDTLRSERFCDQAPAQVVAALLDVGRYLCSERTMYRLLSAHGEVRERRDQLRHPSYARPELLATAPNQLWSWDNCEHHHSGIGLLTPEAVHKGWAPKLREQRQQVLYAAFCATPERFVRGTPNAPKLPTEVWINESTLRSQ